MAYAYAKFKPYNRYKKNRICGMEGCTRRIKDTNASGVCGGCWVEDVDRVQRYLIYKEAERLGNAKLVFPSEEELEERDIRDVDFK